MTDDLLDVVRELPKVVKYLHVPVQSGCDEVLKRMQAVSLHHCFSTTKCLVVVAKKCRAWLAVELGLHRWLLR